MHRGRGLVSRLARQCDRQHAPTDTLPQAWDACICLANRTLDEVVHHRLVHAHPLRQLLFDERRRFVLQPIITWIKVHASHLGLLESLLLSFNVGSDFRDHIPHCRIGLACGAVPPFCMQNNVQREMADAVPSVVCQLSAYSCTVLRQMEAICAGRSRKTCITVALGGGGT